MKRIDYCKLQGCGNSFLVISDLNLSHSVWQKIAPKLLDANFGVGADGIMLVSPAQRADFALQIINKDGSFGDMCGNGIRCVARYLALSDKVVANKEDLSFDINGRIVYCKLRAEGRVVEVNMGPAIFEPKLIPVLSEEPVIAQNLNFSGYACVATVLSMGNPHCVIFIDDPSAIDIAKIGRSIECDKLFPKRTNVEFVKVCSKSRLEMRVWERGVGETLACGSGACAAVVAGAKTGLCDATAEVGLSGGTLKVTWNENCYLEGEAQEISFGYFSKDYLSIVGSVL